MKTSLGSTARSCLKRKKEEEGKDERKKGEQKGEGSEEGERVDVVC